MAISVTCPCGARLEIDEKFLGKDIPCPDCQRLLPTNAPATPPPLDLPDHRRVSGLAVLSLALALVGAFTIVGTLAAIFVGLFAIKQIARTPHKLEGTGYARAGIITGVVFTFVTLAAMVSPTVFGVDVFLRELAAVTHVADPRTDKIEAADGDVAIIRPSDSWLRYSGPNQASPDLSPNTIILINIAEDAYIACQFVSIDELGDKVEDREKKVLEHFYKSELVNLIGRLRGRGFSGEGVVSERKPVGGKDVQEITIDLRLGGIDRRFLIQYTSKQVDKATVLIACARRARFDRLEEEFRKAFATFKAKN